MVDAFGADISPAEAERIGDVLNRLHGTLQSLRKPRPWLRYGGELPAPLVLQLEEIRRGPGDAPRELREAAEAHVAKLSGGQRDEAKVELPEEVLALLDTIALDAHGVTDQQIAHLKQKEWSDEAIYELVFIASFAAGLGRLERAIELLSAR